MAIQAYLPNSVRTRYAKDYLDAADLVRLYDQFSFSVDKIGVENAARVGTTIQVEFLGDMLPSTTAISTSADIVPQVLRDAKVTMTPTSRGDALEWAEALEVNVFTNYGSERFKALGKSQMESIDILARDVCCQGINSYMPAARASLDAGTTTHRLIDSMMVRVANRLVNQKVPPFIGNGKNQFLSLMPPDPYTDLLATGNIISALIYQQSEKLFQQELGAYGAFKLLVSPWAKTFYAAGAANGSAIGTTIATTAVNALDKVVTLTAGTNIVAGGGQRLLIGTKETADTHYVDNEMVWTASTTTAGQTAAVPIIGEGANGGFRFDHPVGATVSNSDNVFPVIFGGPESIAKVYDPQMDSEFGTVVGPMKTGRAEQFCHIAYKFYGGYARLVESWLLRAEVSSAVDA